MVNVAIYPATAPDGGFSQTLESAKILSQTGPRDKKSAHASQRKLNVRSGPRRASFTRSCEPSLKEIFRDVSGGGFFRVCSFALVRGRGSRSALGQRVLSSFLPPSFDSKKPVTLIAGQGLYPVLVAQAIREAGVPLRLIAFDEETRPDLIQSFPENERRTLLVGQLGKMLKTLEQFEAGYALMAGQITPRRLFRGLHPDLKATRILLSLKRRNAETIFGAIAQEIEKLGITLLDARSFLDEQMATEGNMTGGRFPIDATYLEHGIQIARECARLDIGQGVVVRKGTVLAVEAFEGTDEMLRRAGGFKTDSALFVKTVKARQDYRFDVPVFGLRTLETMREATLSAAALEVGRVIILDKSSVLAQARTWGISLHGFI